MSLNREKYQEVILYLCQKLGGEIKGKKKLAKLLYFADFDCYEKNGQSITGDAYKALPMGPFPTALEEITHSMQKEGDLEIGSIQEFGSQYIPTETYRCLTQDLLDTQLNDEEKRILDRVVRNYGALTGKQLEDLSHQEAPYVATEVTKEIPYELAYYRGTDFADV